LGSVVPFILPQICMAIAVSVLAAYLNRQEPIKFFAGTQNALNVVGILLSFLMVFKTQTAYQQFWQALGHVGGILQISRTMAMSAVTVFTHSDTCDIDQEARRIVRLISLHYFVIIEHFQRTGSNAIVNTRLQDRLREDIRQLTGPSEFSELYPHEPAGTSGSKSGHLCANPTMVLFWIQVCIGRVHRAGACAPPLAAALQGHLSSLMSHFWSMDTIDKTQFPLPYSQIVKWLILLYVFTMPFRIIGEAGEWCAGLFTLVVTIGFYGLDEVSEILESPFGNDANDINLREKGSLLLHDLSVIYKGRNRQLDTVFSNEDEFDLGSIMLKTMHGLPVASLRLIQAMSGQGKKNLQKGSTKCLPNTSSGPVRPHDDLPNTSAWAVHTYDEDAESQVTFVT
ncbi:unnamed protein product, partial [Polarella glacialis]